MVKLGGGDGEARVRASISLSGRGGIMWLWVVMNWERRVGHWERGMYHHSVVSGGLVVVVGEVGAC